ncbi:MAG: helix-turn-helix domain-containing protein [Raoultibacter sp.]
MNVEIAERLAKRRREAGFSQEELAARLSVSRQAVSKWERSESSPDTDNLIALAKIYGVSLDDLLYVDEAIAEDVSYEAVDRGAAVPTDAAAGTVSKEASKGNRVAAALEDALFGQIADAVGGANSGSAAGAAGVGGAASTTPPPADAAGRSTSGAQAAGSSKEKAGKDEYVHIGPAGIHVEDGKDSVHISWREGIHVSSSEGDEVHVGWRGIHVTDPEGNTQVGGKWARDKNDGWTCDSDGKWTNTNTNNDAANTNATTNNDANTTTPNATSSSAPNCAPDFDGVVVEGEHFDTWHDAHAKYAHGWNKASAYYAFPFPILATLVYLFLGIGFGLWGIGLLVFLSIPLYYLLVSLFRSRKLAPFLGGLYSLGATAWFLCMAFIQNAPHPAWVIFLTIPLVEWLIWSISHRRRRTMQDSDIIDVDPMVK